MDWFKRKTPSGGVVSTPPKSHSPPPNVTVPDASAAGVPAEPTAEQRLHVLEMERKESEGEYLRRLESLAQVVSEKSEESEQLMEKLRQQEEDMKALIDKLVGQEKELETYKENQTEYKRRLEVLTDCLEDLARENMKLAAKGVPASMPEDYEEERMPTRQEVQIQKTKSEVAAETAAKSVPNKTASRNMPTDTHTQYNAAPTKAITETPPPIVKPSPRTKPESTETHALIHTSSSAPTSPTTTHANEAKEAHPDANKEISRRNTPSPTGGLVLPSKSKSKGELRDTPAIKSLTDSAGTALLKGADTPPISATPPSTSAPSKHKRAPSNENDFSSMAGDPKALMVVLKKYKAQADSLRRVRFAVCPRFSVCVYQSVSDMLLFRNRI